MTQYGSGEGTRISPSTVVIGHAAIGLTLDDFATVMDYPACDFMGVMATYDCSPLIGASRNRIISAAETATGMIESQLNRRGRSLYNTATKLTSKQPYFDLIGYTAKTIATKRYTAHITIDAGGDDCSNFTATLEAVIDPLEACQELYSVSIIWPAGAKRLGVRYLTGPALHDVNLTITAYAYNFIDLDAFSGTVPTDSIPYMTEVDIEVSVAEASIPQAVWNPDMCNPPVATDCENENCLFNYSDGCLMERRNGIYEVRDYWQDCDCSGLPERFELMVLTDGLWSTTFVEAVISLMNTRLPSDFCGCDKLVNQRFMEDNARSEKYARVYPYSYNNGFGILAPGAQFAWKQIDRILSDTIVMRM